MTEIEEVYKHLTRNHRELIGLIDEHDDSFDPHWDEPGDHGEMTTAFLGLIRDRSSDNFGDRYDQADE